MPEDHGTKDAAMGAVPGSDATVPAPAAPAALTDKDLDKVSGGLAMLGDISVSNSPLFKAPTDNTFGTRLK